MREKAFLLLPFIILVLYSLLLILLNKYTKFPYICARARVFVCVRASYKRLASIHLLIAMREFPPQETTAHDYKFSPSGINTMKNTSFFVSFWAMPERKPSADSAKRKRARFRALGGTRVIGAKPLIACCNLAQAYGRSPCVSKRACALLSHKINENPSLLSSDSAPSCSHIVKVTPHPFWVER